MRFKNILNRAGSFGLAVLTALTICPTNFTQASEPVSEVTETSVETTAMVYVTESEYGTTTVNDAEGQTEAVSGETVKVKVSANEGYQVSAVTAASADGLTTFEVYAADDHYEFVMPETDVYVTTWYETASAGEEEPSSEEATEVIEGESSEETESTEGTETAKEDKISNLQQRMDALPDVVLDGSATSKEEELEQYYAAMETVDGIQAEIDELTDEEYAQLDFTRFAAYATMVYSMYQPINNVEAASLGGASNALGSSAVTVTVASEVWLIPGVGCWNYHFELSNGVVAYCGEATAPHHPGVGTAVAISEYTGSGAELMKKVLYYGADGDAAVLTSSEINRATTGFALSYAYSGKDVEDAYAMGGISEYSGTGAAFVYQVSKYAAVPSGYKLYKASCGYSGYQTLFYLVYEAGAVTINKSAVSGVDTSEYPLTGALYSVYDQNNTWMGSFITGAGGTGYVAKYVESESKIPSTEGTVVVKYGDGWYYADDWTTSLSLNAGTYTLYEKVAPSHYATHSDGYTFTVTTGSTTALTADSTGILEDSLTDGYVKITKSVDTPVGTISLTKTSADTSVTAGNSAYSLEGAVYGIYSDSSCSTKVGEMITDASGKATSKELTLGTYYVKEISASKGYALNGTVYTVSLTSSTTFNKAAVYTVYSKTTAVGTLTCDATTGVSNTLTLTDGTYTLKETTPASGYALNSGSYSFTISAGSTLSLTGTDTALLKDTQSTKVNVSLNVTEKPLLGSVTIKKSAVSGVDISKYPLTGALYSVYDQNNTWMGSFITGAKGTGYVAKYVESENEIPSTEGTIVVKYGNGWYYADDWTTSLSLKAGTYKILEKVAPSHYASHSDSHTFVVAPGEAVSLTADSSGILEDPLLDGYVQITKSVDTVVGHINLTKTSKNTSITDGNDCYSLEGAVYGIYADKNCKEEVGRITTDAEGKATSEDIVVGTYYVKEITASKGYALDDTVYTVNVQPTNITFNKAAVYTVYSANTAVGTLTCDATTGVSNTLTLPDGTYTLKETTPASGYALNGNSYEFAIIAGETTSLTNADTDVLNDIQETEVSVPLNVTETPLSDPGQVTLIKKSANKVVYIEGAIFKVEYFDNYNTSGTATRIWYYETDSDGIIDLHYEKYLSTSAEYRSDALYYDASDDITLPLGSIKVTEIYAPEGYKLLEDSITGTIVETNGTTKFAWTDNGQHNITASNEIEAYDEEKYGSVTVNKEDVYTTFPEGDASFDGIEVTVYNNSGKNVYIPEDDDTFREVKNGEAVCVLTFEEGESTVSTDSILPLGIYTVKETAANECYLLNEEWTMTATLADDGTDVLQTTYENSNNTVQNTPVRGGVKVQKVNEELGKAENEGLSSLKDCVIAIVNASDAEVYVNGNIYQSIYNPYTKGVEASNFTKEELIEMVEDAEYFGENVVVATITTDENGVATTANDLLPYGTYYLYEVSANDSMQVDEDWTAKIEIRENGVIVDADETPVEDPVVRGDIFFEKTNETGYGKANIPFLLVSYDADGNAIEAHVIVTGAEGYTDTAHYYVSDESGIHMVDRDNTYMTNGFDDYVKYNAVTGEYYVTAEGEALLESGEAATYGIWFSRGIDPETGALTGSVADPDNSRGALYYGNYKLFEIKCNDNTSKGENLLYSDEYIPITRKDTTVDENGNITKEISDFLVRSSKRFQDLEIELTSEALDVASSTDSKKSHVTFVKEDVQLSDTISYTHLESTTEYKWVINFVETDDPANVLSTVTIDRYRPVKQSDTEKVNTTFGEFTISTDGTLTDADCLEEPVITTTGNIDTSNLEGKSISAVVYLYEYTTGYDFESETPSTMEVLNFVKSHNADCSDENEIVYVPSMETEASDKYTEDHVGTNVGTTAIIDKVSMTNIGPMEYYLLVETVMDKDTGEVFAKAEQLTQTFYADRNDVDYIDSYEVTMNDLEISSEDLAGAKTLVAYEELWRADKNGNKIDEYPVVTHEDIFDEDETIWYPGISTNASDLSTGDEVGTSGKEAIIRDEVTYENLLINEEYVIKGKLVYQEDFVDAEGTEHKAGDVLMQNGEECTAEVTLDAEKHEVNGTTTLEFTVDSSILEGATLVAYEELYHNGVKVALHADITDEAQTVHIPKIRTAAVDSETRDHVGSVFGTGINSIRNNFEKDVKEDQMQVIIDTVELTNLVPGKTYTVSGVLMDKTTGEQVLMNGEPVTKTVNITVSTDGIVADGGETGTLTMYDEAHNRVDGMVTVTYSLDSAALMNYGSADEKKLDIVVFEDLIHNEVTVASHADINDEDQSVYNASIDTVASDVNTKDHVGDTPRKEATAEDIEDELTSTITDVVSFDGLVPGEEYTVTGQLVLRDDTIISGQTVYLNANGNATTDTLEAVSAAKTFIADAEKMDISLDFEVSSENVAGKTIVVYERLFHNKVMVTLHCDPYDEDETIYYPDVCTAATDGYTTDRVGTVTAEGIFCDDVKLTNLIAGETYEVGGMLKYESDVLDENGNIVYHKGDTVEDAVLTGAELNGEELEIVDGKAVFTVPELTEESNEITVTLKYELNTAELNGYSLVALEKLYHNGVVVATHADIEDESQTVHYPNIYTNASDISTGDDVGSTITETTILDEVTYENLLEDEEYVIRGKLVYQEDFVDAEGTEHKAGEVLVQDGIECTAETTLAAGEHESEGLVTLEFTISSDVLEGATLVAYEELYHNDVKVTVHADIDDDAQTVHLPKIRTVAIDSETKDHVGTVFGSLINAIRRLFGEDIAENQMQVITDTVELTNLVPGRTYTVSGVLMDKTTGEQIIVNGEPVTKTVNITVSGDAIIADNDEVGTVTMFDETHNRVDGTVTVTYSLDPSLLMNYGTEDEIKLDTVVFEDLIHNDVIVATHSDLTDESQSVYNASIDTLAADKATKDHVGDTPRKAVTAEDIEDELTSIITDTVSLDGLAIGEEYTVKGQLVLKDDTIEAGKTMYLTAEGETTDNIEEAISSTTTFVAESESTDVSLDFEVSSENVAGKTIVVYERLIHNGVITTLHCDLYDEEQSVHYPDIYTNASDISTGDDVGSTITETTILDEVTYENLLEDEEYVIRGKLVYQEDFVDVNGVEHKAGEVVIVPSYSEETLVQEAYDEPVSKVVYTCECGSTFESRDEVESHQAESGCITGSWKSVTEYVHHDAVYETVTTDAYECTAETVLAAGEHTTDGTVTLEFTVNGSALKGATLVAYEELYHNDVKVTTHADIDDDAQTVHFPEIYTTAVDSKTQDHVGSVFGSAINAIRSLFGEEVTDGQMQVITDTVTLKNLVLGRTYTINGYLIDKSTGLAVMVNDEPVTKTVNFTVSENGIAADNGETGTVTMFDEAHNRVDGTVTITYCIDSAALMNYGTEDEISLDTVVYEFLIHNGTVIARHSDLTDEAQSVYNASIKTVATDKATGNHVGDSPRQEVTAEDIEDELTSTITDVVSLNGLVVGEEYTVEGRLVLKDETNESGSPVYLNEKGDATDNEEEAISSTTTFVADAKSMDVTLDFEITSEKAAGRTVVVYEKLFHNGIMITLHCNPDDKAETIWYPYIETTAFDVNTAKRIIDDGSEISLNDMSHVGVVGTTTISDIVQYHNLIADEEYTVEGRLVYTYDVLDADGNVIHKAGDLFCDKNGNAYTVSTVLNKGHLTQGIARVNFEIDSSMLAGVTLTVEEVLINGETTVAAHADINDEAQQIYFPELIRTTLTGENGSKLVNATETIKLVDKVEYTNLVPGNTYRLDGVLMDKTTGEEALDDNGEKITATAEFTPENSDGVTEVVFEFSGVSLAGTSLVAFETLYYNGVIVNLHADIEDEDQTVYLPEIGTALSDAKGNNMVNASTAIKLTDTVNYKNLIAGQSYKLDGVLMDKATGKELLDDNGKKITAEATFTPESTEGSVEVTFEFSGVSLAGKTAVAFETLYFEESEIASHTDIEDEAQTVYIPKVSTSAAFKDGSKSSTADLDNTIVDKVTYSNLVAGKTYIVRGRLMGKTTNAEITVNKNAVTAESRFTAQSTDGEVTLEFAVPKETFMGDVVVFEELYLEGETGEVLVGEHKDLNDAQQTVSISTPPETGDTDITPFAIIGAAAVLLALAGIFILIKRKKNEKVEQ